MTSRELVALLPVLGMAAGAVIVMLAIAVRRNHFAAFLIAALALAGSFAGLFVSASCVFSVGTRDGVLGGTIQVTPLFTMDPFARTFTGLAILANLFIAVLAYRYMKDFHENREEFYLLLLIETIGAAVLASSTHFASFFLGFETLSIALYGLLAYTRRRAESIEAGIKYLILAGAASAFILFGMALIYAEAGSLDLRDLAGMLADRGAMDSSVSGSASVTAIAGLAMIIIGIGFKLALVPFHMWVGDVYQGAPAPSTATIASVSKIAALAVFYRFIPAMGVTHSPSLKTALTAFAVLSMLAGNWLALLQGNAKRMLAYSSISHMGYLMIPLFVSTGAGQTALLFYLTGYVIASTGSFGIITVLSSPDSERETVEGFRGFARERPVLAGAFILMLISLAGIPLTVGFMGKLFLFSSSVGSSQWVLAAALALGSAIGLFYYLRLVSVQFMEKPEGAGLSKKGRVSLSEGIVLTVLVMLVLGLGVYPSPFIGLIQSLAQVP